MDGAPVRKKGLLLLQAKVPVNRYLLSHYQFVHAYISWVMVLRVLRLLPEKKRVLLASQSVVNEPKNRPTAQTTVWPWGGPAPAHLARATARGHCSSPGRGRGRSNGPGRARQAEHHTVPEPPPG